MLVSRGGRERSPERQHRRSDGYDLLEGDADLGQHWLGRRIRLLRVVPSSTRSTERLPEGSLSAFPLARLARPERSARLALRVQSACGAPLDPRAMLVRRVTLARLVLRARLARRATSVRLARRARLVPPPVPGPTGATGPAGPQGPAGPAGPQGPPGLDGSTIVTATATAENGEKTTSVTCPDGRYAISGGFIAQGSVTAFGPHGRRARPDSHAVERQHRLAARVRLVHRVAPR